MAGALSRTRIPRRPRHLHCEISEGEPQALGCGAANLGSTQVGGPKPQTTVRLRRLNPAGAAYTQQVKLSSGEALLPRAWRPQDR